MPSSETSPQSTRLKHSRGPMKASVAVAGSLLTAAYYMLPGISPAPTQEHAPMRRVAARMSISRARRADRGHERGLLRKLTQFPPSRSDEGGLPSAAVRAARSSRLRWSRRLRSWGWALGVLGLEPVVHAVVEVHRRRPGMASCFESGHGFLELSPRGARSSMRSRRNSESKPAPRRVRGARGGFAIRRALQHCAAVKTPDRLREQVLHGAREP
jgi:hypothetical protein